MAKFAQNQSPLAAVPLRAARRAERRDPEKQKGRPMGTPFRSLVQTW
jgi:hypothetical protein